MATTTEKRVIIIDVKGASEAVKDLKALQRHAKNTDKNIARMGKTLGNLGFTIKAFIAYRLTAYLASMPGAILDVSDSMSLMKSRLDLVNEGTRSTTVIMSDLFEIAERSRGSIDAVSTLYTRLSVSGKALGASQQQVLNFTELVSDTFLLSGASAGEAASGVTQISQAMAKGKLDGDEFKSVMENNVYFGELLAETLGVTRGELLEMSKGGLITGDVLLKMGNRVEETRSKVAKMPTTFDQAGTAWSNAAKAIIEDADTVNFAFEKIAKGSALWARTLQDWLTTDTAIEAGTKAFEAQQKVVDELQVQLTAMTDPLATFYNSDISSFNKKLDETLSKFKTANEQLKYIRENLEQDAAFARGEVGPELPKTKPDAPSGDVKDTPFSKWIKEVKEADKELALFFPKIEALDNMLFAGAISESTHAQALERITGSMSEAKGGMSEFQTEMAALQEIINSTRTPAEELAAQIELINDKLAEGLVTTDKATEAIAALQEQFDKRELEKNKDEWVDWANVAETGVKGVTGAFIDMALSGKSSFEDFAQSFLINIAKMIAQAAVLKALQGASGSGGFLGLFPSANGNVFNGGNIVPFANGGIVDSPTIFPMASGAALIGEAGPEAVLPLSRGTDGKLGVKSSGGSGEVTVNIANYGNTDVAESSSTDSQGNKSIDIIITEKINTAMKQGGMDKSMKGNYGINRRGY